METKEYIGKVLMDNTYYGGEDIYSDGSIEDEILEIVKSTPESGYDDVIKEKDNWPILYHLSAQRENIVASLPISKKDKVLEIGSGCGAVSGALARMCGELTCVDLSRKRSLINANRHKDLDNMTIFTGNFTDIEKGLPCDFDCICLIGVYEYSDSYIGGDTPHKDFLEIIGKHLSPDGCIVIAIENRLGMKYFAGCREDHLGTYFSGIEGYPEGSGVRTFSRPALEKLLDESGFTNRTFGYPYPDYKFCSLIFTDERLPEQGELTRNLRNFDSSRLDVFDEKRAFDASIEDGLFPVFSNSYIVVARRKEKEDGDRCIYVKCSNERNPEYAIKTMMMETPKGERYILKAAEHGNESYPGSIKKSGEALEKKYDGTELKINKGTLTDKGLKLEYVKGTGLETLLDECIDKNDTDGYRKLILKYKSLIEHNADVAPWNRDMIFQNIIVSDKGEWNLIDYEWTSDEKIEAKDLAYRSLFCFAAGVPRRENFDREWFDDTFGGGADDYRSAAERERDFQRSVTDKALVLENIRASIGNAVVCALPEQKDAPSYSLQIYTDRGNGYTPEECVTVPNAYHRLTAGTGRVEVDFVIPEGAKEVRIDPVSFICVAQIRSLAIDGREVSFTKIRYRGQSLGPGEIFFRDNDPGIRVKVKGCGGKRLTASMIVSRVLDVPEEI